MLLVLFSEQKLESQERSQALCNPLGQRTNTSRLSIGYLLGLPELTIQKDMRLYCKISKPQRLMIASLGVNS